MHDPRAPNEYTSRPEQPASTAKGAEKQEATTATTPSTASRQNLVCILFLTVVIIVVVVLVVVLTRDNDDDNQEDPSSATGFETGVSLVTHYGVNTTITSRLARTILTIVTANALDCASIHGITIQLPLAARVAYLKTMADNGCNTHGKVQTLKEARETFVEAASHSLPGAYIEERDSFTHSLQVAMAPLGTTRVELVLEELLHQRVGQVKFQVPFTPNEEVDQVKMDISILDINQTRDVTTATPVPPTQPPAANSTTNSSVATPPTAAPTIPAVTEGTNFHLDLYLPNITANATDELHLELPNARQCALPKVLSGYYKPSLLPENGAFFTDGTCFEHYFLPNDVVSMPKNIVFLIDISIDHPNQLRESKKALKNLIDSLTSLDSLTIQAFARKGTEKLWGKGWGTEGEKIKAKKFVDNLESVCCSTDLHEAYLEGLLRAKRDAIATGVVSILTMISYSEPSNGETDRAKIASDVWKLNQDGNVKMFSLAFHDADRQLLSAIAIMNGGQAFDVLDGQQDYATQMQDFFASQFGDVLLSDIRVDFSGDDAVEAYGETRNTFPVLADGSEVVVRGLLTNQSSEPLKATTTAVTKDGEKTWIATAEQDPFVDTPGLANSRCFQGYAHSRITQLMHLRDAAELLGDAVLEPVVFLVNPCTGSLVDCIEQEALSLAIEANVVAEGLTGMVTMDVDECQTFEEDSEICLDGSSANSYRPFEDEDPGYIPTSGSFQGNFSIVLVFLLCSWFAALQ